MKATGIVRRIDDLGRVVIPKEIRRTLRIRGGDALEIFTDRDGEVILKKYSPIAELADFAQEYVDSLAESTGQVALVADRDEIIAVSGAPKKGLLGKKVSSGVQVALERGETVTFDDPPAIESFPSGGQVAAPVMQEGELAGSVLILARDGKLSDLEKRLAETAANFLAKHLG
ncbi:MAG TPA: AbrB/MazE/SpoVT family DNA-binding domain-containing protein [Firmicutes bacterium]|jgi:stage V sporulation protein T|nr:AbrB/MazE/SpoVT family DNA-binding domain-containing protein [Bacillota bacterium]